MAQKKGSEADDLKEAVRAAKPGDVLELDEAWSFVGKKANRQWLWVALCRRTREIVAFVIGDRSAKTCARLWSKIPEDYKRKQSFSDFWDAYEIVFPKQYHQQVDKKSGACSHVERWFCTLRQRLARFVRKTLSFSKSERMHHLTTKLFVMAYNRQLSLRN
jgi:IS1 family transposase